MAIDFSGALTSDNYSTGVLAKLNATDIANAVWLDSAYTSYTGTITTGAKRITTGGVIEQYNGSAWVALSVGYVLKAGDTMTGTLLHTGIDEVVRIHRNGGYFSAYDAAGTTRTGYIQWNAGADITHAAENGAYFNWFIGGSERMRLDTSGRLGVGVTPSYPIHFQKSQNAASVFMQENLTAGTASSANLYVRSDAASVMIGAYSSLFTGNANGTFIGTTSNHNLSFGTNSAVKLMLDTSGTLYSYGNGSILQRIGASTAAQSIRLANTSGDFYFGNESSVAGSFFPGSSAYASVLYSTQPIQAIVSAVKILDISSTGLAVTGTLSATGTSSLARIDQSNGSINFASLGNGSTSWQIGTQTALKPLDIFIGGAVIAQFSDTGLAVTGTLSASGVFSLTGGSVNPIVVSGATTGESYGKFTNTSGQTVFGVNNSVAGTLYSGGTAYASFFGSNVAKNVDLIVNGSTVASLASTGLAVTGTITATGGITTKTLTAEVATTSGTTVDFTGIPAGTKEIVIMLNAVSTSGTSNPIIQIGDSGGIETSGYDSVSERPSVIVTTFTAGFGLLGSTAGSNTMVGRIVLSLQKTSTNNWTASGIISGARASGNYTNVGVKALSAELDRIRLTTVGGTDTFDSGSISIQYSQ